MDDYEKQDKQKIGKGDTVRITKARKNEEGEWNVKIFVNGKNYKPAEIFADSKDDAELQAKDAKDLYKRKGATVIGEKGSAKKEEKEEPDFEEPSLKEEILALSGVVLSEEKMKIASPGDIRKAERFYNREKNKGNKVVDAGTAKRIERTANRERNGGGKVVFNKGGISVKLANGESWFFQAGDDANSVIKDAPTNVDKEDYIFWIAQGW